MYIYHQQVLDELAGHGLRPAADTPPQQLRDAVRDLYKYEIRRLRDRLIARQIPKRDYAGHVVALRKRYWLLSIPMQRWTLPKPGPDGDQGGRGRAARSGDGDEGLQ